MILPAAAGAKVVPVTRAAVFDSALTSVNMSETSGSLHLVLNRAGKKLIVRLIMRNVQGRYAAHSAAITGFLDGRVSQLPGPSADTDHDGFISKAEYAAVAGATILRLEPFPALSRRGGAVFQGKFLWADLKDLGDVKALLNRSAVVIFGCFLEPPYGVAAYHATAPAANGLIHGR
jgi:hypothetical protein